MTSINWGEVNRQIIHEESITMGIHEKNCCVAFDTTLQCVLKGKEMCDAVSLHGREKIGERITKLRNTESNRFVL